MGTNYMAEMGTTSSQEKAGTTPEECVWTFEGDHPAKSENLDGIAAGFNYFHAQFKAAVHHYTNRVIDTRAGKMYWCSNATWIKADGDLRVNFMGDYEADIVQDDGVWKIKQVMT